MTPKHEQRRLSILRDSTLSTIQAHLEYVTQEVERLRIDASGDDVRDRYETELCRAIAFRMRTVLFYNGTRRLINPHLIRETADGHLVVVATRTEDHDDGSDNEGRYDSVSVVRSYRLDKIEDLRVTSEHFTFTTEG